MKSILDRIASSGYIGPLLDALPYISRRKARNIYEENFLQRKIILSKHEEKVLSKAEESDKSVLFSGPRKSGNTWARFVLFNYYNVKYKESERSLTYDELNKIQSTTLANGGEIKTHSESNIFFVRTHRPFYGSFKSFNKVVYIYRNPLDTLISNYYSSRALNGISEDTSIEEYIEKNIGKWVRHFNKTYPNSDISLAYNHRKKDPLYEYEKMIDEIENRCDYSSLKKSVKMSSIKNIKRMEEEENQRHGNYPGQKDKLEEDFRFTRSGKVGQYEEKLSKEFVRSCKSYIREQEVEDDIL